MESETGDENNDMTGRSSRDRERDTYTEGRGKQRDMMGGGELT